MNATAPQRCAHPACTCTVPAGQSYCSEHCRQVTADPQPGDDSEGCRCGHRACQPEQSLQSAHHI
jgi:hypothetical protein